MAEFPEARQPQSGPFPSVPASNRRRWCFAYPTRLSSVLLLMVWVGPVTFVQTDSAQLLRVGDPERAAAESQVIPASMALVLEPGTSLKLHLRDGSVRKGRFLGRTLLDSALYAPRFAARARSSSYVPFALGETLRVSLRDGREWAAPFAGYGELTLLLRSPEGPQYLRVPFEFASEIRRANGDRVEPSDLSRAFHAGLLPSAEALELEQRQHNRGMAKWVGAPPVAVEDIKSATPESSSSSLSGTEIAGIVVLSVIVSVVLICVLIARSIRSSIDKCGSVPFPQFLTRVHVTTRPFDRYRGCYAGDALAVADPWPGPSKGSPATALADQASTHVPAR